MTGYEPPVSEEATAFWEATRRRELVLPWCCACTRPFWYPRPVCPACLGADIEWRRASGDGEVYAVAPSDRVIVDAPRLQAVIEWTHFKPRHGIHLRGDEWYVFSGRGLIREIRAYYACPAASDPIRSHGLGDFDYAGRGYPMSAPRVKR